MNQLKLFDVRLLTTVVFIFVVGLQPCSSQDTSSGTPPRITEIRKTRSDSLARTIPAPTGFINDFAHLFNASEIKTLDSLVTNFERQTTIEIGVATVDSTMVRHADFEDYSLVMLRVWGVGKKEKNNGLLIVVAPHLRRIRIQNGYGIEKLVSDAETKTIVETRITPKFKKGKYFEGTRDGIFGIINKLKQKGI